MVGFCREEFEHLLMYWVIIKSSFCDLIVKNEMFLAESLMELEEHCAQLLAVQGQ